MRAKGGMGKRRPEPATPQVRHVGDYASLPIARDRALSCRRPFLDEAYRRV